jgi:putative oxidoreductase
MSDLMQTIGRVAVAALFVWSGLSKLLGPANFAATLAAKGLPMPKALAYLAGTLEFGLGLLVAIGWQVGIAAAGLVILTAAVTLMSHKFWTMTGEAYRLNQLSALKNLSIIGALLMLAATGPGRFAVGKR